ncbi:PP2C family protein-serine/threonine phosphatase [Actinophytocola sp. KF-1]
MLEAVTDSTLVEIELEKLVEVLLGQVPDLFEGGHGLGVVRGRERGAAGREGECGSGRRGFQGVRVPLGAGFAGRVARLRQPVQIDRVDSSTVVNPLLWEHELRVLLGVPMMTQEELVGVLHVGRTSACRFDDEDVELLRLVADRVTMAAVLHRSRSEQAAAATLVESLMPAQLLPRAPGWEVAGRYVPGAEIGIGGDWHDVFPLPRDRIGLVIGDVAGNGLPAAIVMGRLRSALRAYALEFDDPAVVLEKVDRKASHFERTVMATVGFLVVDTVNSTMDVASAGHLPPLVAIPGQEPGFVHVPVGLPIGFGLGVTGRGSTTADLPAGGLVVCYTDGLVERRGEPIDDGLERLRATLRSGSAEAVCAHHVHNGGWGSPPPTISRSSRSVTWLEATDPWAASRGGTGTGGRVMAPALPRSHSGGPPCRLGSRSLGVGSFWMGSASRQRMWAGRSWSPLWTSGIAPDLRSGHEGWPGRTLSVADKPMRVMNQLTWRLPLAGLA